MGKYKFLGIFGIIGSFISNSLGGWNKAMTTLIIFMIIDYVTGFVVAGIFKKSSKTKNGTLESNVGFKGLFRKGMMLSVVFIAARLDLVFQTNFIKDSVLIAYIVNEAISIVENAGLMGIPIPKIIKNSIEAFKNVKEKDFNE